MYQRKTRDEYQIHGNYGYGYEEVTCAETLREARQNLNEHRENERQASFKLVHKRFPITVEGNQK